MKIYTDYEIIDGVFTPASLEIEGIVDLRHSDTITSLPSGMVIEGSLRIGHCGIKNIPTNTIVHGALDLTYSVVESISSGVVVNDVFIAGNCKITTLPKDIVLNGSIDLAGSLITNIEHLKHVKGFLDLENTSIKVLPSGLIVDRWMSLLGTNITKIPDDLSCGELFLNADITNYPVVYNCGDSNRAIYLTLEDKNLIQIGCTAYDKDTAIEKIFEKYFDAPDERDKYIAKVEECYALYETLKEQGVMK